ncbi:GlxA family transcriptional regulator [Arenimonas composti]|uniref:HTH araC/xylS-type domain-containing protein n=1 Tax=Arenimonas composti TR7-09 = DSM 18010 TaxID=1121013 RepID=A0A091BD09_9GAMM|nr:GlxA family transcriptional regulator [Arenimonas composti]KFN48719.1 hypothetical protein P873_13765 [Arenimonas composti TR7-09 = DSM 18010]
MAAPRPRSIGFLGYPGITALDLTGPLEAFATANALLPGEGREGGATPRPYRLLVLGVDGKSAFASEPGLRLQPDCAMAAAPALDTVIVPGGAGLREPRRLRAAAGWLRTRQRATRRIASVCTGAWALAEAGLLDGRRATTHWRFAAELAARYPAVDVDADAIWIRAGRCYTSAGVTAGIDLALALIEQDHGPRLALAVARELVVHVRRAGGQRQYSERLAFQGGSAGRLAELREWMLTNLAGDLSVERLAERCHVSPRQLTRRFRDALGITPAACVERLRVEEAGERLLAGAGIDAVAAAVGFRSTDVFRRAFERHYGVPPSSFRARFAATTPP